MTFVVPSGEINARYSPFAFNSKSVWSGDSGSIRSFPEAKTMILEFGAMVILGNVH